MIRSFVALIACAFALGLSAGEAEAKRFGGSKSFGMQRSAPAATPKAAPTAPKAGAAANATPKRNSWLGPIAGLAAGLGLAALFSHLGMGEELGSLLLMALLAFVAFKLFRRFAGGATQRAPQGMQYAGPAPTNDTAETRFNAAPAGGSSAAAAQSDFDEAGFVRQAKINFIRMQAAYDAGNLDDIRAFTTPDVFAEVKMQLDERADGGQQTDVVDLTADVIEVVTEAERYIVSVRFHGLIRENRDAAPEAFDEVWHLTKPITADGGWLISGIQQAH
ncbi:Tim44 domain-containing protein [Denitromonas ohlonensis]|jgi:predicted lipid-binding transport protein (Tim44 family)|uniref:Tim44 domain-containing protein n=2 Tax=Denitromonas TaxID=139331 RepID=A0A558ELM3_9RHOO|nr:Tim44-like domain-containing protein [Denitromonas ohlonensis]TVT46039.1 MAG: Tim44 domain-containing protein [Denitromonas halophila]TVO67657.1 Tim44 domain-containing protein [Denitromonas ohlonensis]TVO76515.1 Tim44 domain-containing protein [Denitromonas ohlonensis]TVT74251.1 MAG: Tim44 domain-containing protein [Denitromonas halophila]TVT77178.1 MAG: Tim44 domain-containing protein [Denitromonas halophila]